MAILTDDPVSRINFSDTDVVFVKPPQVRFVEANRTAAHLNLQIALGNDITIMARREDAKKLLEVLRKSGCITDDDLRSAVVVEEGRHDGKTS